MVMLNDEAAQVPPELSAARENPKLPESSRPSVVPTGDQLAADATDGNTNAHSAIATPKSNMLFFKTLFNISNTPCESRQTPGSNAVPERRHTNDALRGPPE
jgi:hypothetical protein